MVKNFNVESEKSPFSYKRNPTVENAYLILQWKEEKADYEVVGDYTLLDLDEDPELTEKTVINLVTVLNGRTDRILDLKNLTSERLLFNILTNEGAEESNKITIMLRTHDQMGVSEENAVIKIEKGVFDVRT